MTRQTAIVLWLTAALGLGAPVAPAAQLVQWTDEQGRVHFTDDPNRVPPARRGTIEVLGPAPRPPGPSPAPAEPRASGREVIRFRPGGPMMASARINGQVTVTLMVDTGASVTVIQPHVLLAIGVRLDGPTVTLHTANGPTQGRQVTLQRLEVGQAVVAPLEVVALDIGPPGQGVIGLDFLRHFDLAVDSRAGTMTLAVR